MARRNQYASKSKINKYNSLVKKLRSKLNAIEEYDPDSVVMERYRSAHRTLAEGVRYLDRTVTKAINKISELLDSDRLSLDTYKRSKALGIEKLQKAGLDYINERNFNSFMRFLNDAQARGLGTVFSSDTIVDKIKEAKNMGLTKAQINENIRRWEKQYIKRDKEGKIIEVVNPPEMKVVKVRKLHPDRRKKKKRR